jgi:hypothetical protein
MEEELEMEALQAVMKTPKHDNATKNKNVET